MFCTNCGKSIVEGALFCSNCGTKIQTPQSADAQIKEAEFIRQAEALRQEEARRQKELEYIRLQEEARRQAEYRRLAEEEYARQREARIQEIETQYKEQYAVKANKEQNVSKYRSTAITAMILGILSLDLGVIGIPGWVLSLIAKGKALPIVEEYEGTPIYGFAKAGLITSKVALPLSIFMTIFWTIYVLGFGSIGMV